jgi:flagellar export protein FliJ
LTFVWLEYANYRRQRLELEEAALDKLSSELRSLEADSARLDHETGRTRGLLMVTTSVDGRELVEADRYLRHLADARKRNTERVSDCRARIRKQREVVVEARRRLRLLEQLEERQRRDWTAESDREQENLSSELYLARWKNP